MQPLDAIPQEALFVPLTPSWYRNSSVSRPLHCLPSSSPSSLSCMPWQRNQIRRERRPTTSAAASSPQPCNAAWAIREVSKGTDTRLGRKKGRKAYRIDIHQRDACKVTHQSNKLVEVIGTAPCDQGTQCHDEKAEPILLPLDVWVVLATLSKERVLRDTDRGKDLERC